MSLGERIRQAFAVDPPGAVEPTSDQQPAVDWFCKQIAKRGLTTPGLVAACWEVLHPGGRLVANAVTLEGEAQLLSMRDDIGGDLTRLEVSREKAIGRFHRWSPLAPVTQLSVLKADR